MKPITIKSLIGVLVAVAVGSFIAFAGSHNSAVFGDIPILAGLPVFAVCALLAFGTQWIAFVPAYVFQTEHYYDLMGGITYLSLVVLAVVANPFLDLRGGLVAVLVGVWAIRLSTFLFRRVKEAGFDRRFSKMKTIPAQFLMTWTIQGLWVLVTFAAGLAAMTSVQQVPLEGFALVGTAVWLLGFVIEVVADAQKRRFRRDKTNIQAFITTGLWSWSRHPNYFGEIVLWLGIAIIAVPTLAGWQLATLISPVFVFVLLNYVSGVRMLEYSSDKRWGDDPEYQAYKAGTSVLIPLPPKG
ncbi:MAG: steroid 5-alpha reductase family enzyme [Cyclobacteriaceae bacterium]|jgi:steroid 5-alpha reductase family enzyme